MDRVLILYIVRNSGHHAAARAVESAFNRIAPSVETRCLDLLEVTHPRWERVVQRLYMSTIRRTPELWEALYDNFWVEYLTRRLRCAVQGGQGETLHKLMASFKPDAVVCTQAYPFAVMTSFSARHHEEARPLIGVTTDFVPHRFWITNGNCNAHYVVATDSGATRLMWLGVPADRIHAYGIPVHVDHVQPRPLSTRGTHPRVVVMGGSRGIGVRFRTVQLLDRCPAPFTIDVVCGTNRNLQKRLVHHRDRFVHPIRVRGYVRNSVALMARAELILTKAGGMTLAEAMCMGVPLLLVRPLPGQERGNTEELVHRGAAVHVTNEYDVPRSVSVLLGNAPLLGIMRTKALELARPAAAQRVVELALGCAAQKSNP